MPSLGIEYDDCLLCFLLLFCICIIKNLSAGVLFVFNPVSVQMVLSPQVHWPPYINRRRDQQQTNQVSVPKDSLYIVATSTRKAMARFSNDDVKAQAALELPTPPMTTPP